MGPPLVVHPVVSAEGKKQVGAGSVNRHAFRRL